MLISLAGCQSDINDQFIGQTVHHSVVVITVGQLNKVPDGNKSERLSSVSYPTKKLIIIIITIIVIIVKTYFSNFDEMLNL